jgi:hypothetical protein
VNNLQCVLGGQTGWSRHFFDPIPTGDGGELRTHAGVYILALPPAEDTYQLLDHSGELAPTLTDGGHLRCDWPCPEGKGQTFESRAFAQQLQAIEALEVDKLLEGQMKTSPTARWRGSDTPLAFCEP